MRVPVLMTMTFVPATTALLKSVMRPVRDASEDWAYRGPSENRLIIRVRTTTSRQGTSERRESAMREESTIEKITVTFLGSRRTSPSVASYIGISVLSRHSRQFADQNLRCDFFAFR